MATIVPTVISTPGLTANVMKTLTATTLTGTADTFVYDPTVPGAVLIMENPTGGSLTPVITGSLSSAALTVPGLQQFNTSGGFTAGAIAAGAARGIALDAVALWLPGVITITNGTGLKCYLLTQG